MAVDGVKDTVLMTGWLSMVNGDGTKSQMREISRK